MADILIRGMEMPENCGDCYFCDEWAKCQLLNLNNIFDYCKDGIERPVKCPLVPLPEGHGRLIDADKMRESIRRQAGLLKLMGGEFAEIAETLEKGFLQEVDNAPTIVPAEGGGEDG